MLLITFKSVYYLDNSYNFSKFFDKKQVTKNIKRRKQKINADHRCSVDPLPGGVGHVWLKFRLHISVCFSRAILGGTT